MKKIKFLFLITLILITCTGCDIEYNINITENNIEETINVIDYITTNRTKEDILKHYNMWYPAFVNFLEDGESIEIEDFNEKVEGIKYHNKKIQEIANGYNYTYNYKYDIDKYYDSYVLASIFPETTIYEEIDKLVIRTSKNNFLCDYDYFDSAKINITFDPEKYTINYTNTNDIKNNTYTWTLDRENCNNSEIVLTLNKYIPGIDDQSNNLGTDGSSNNLGTDGSSNISGNNSIQDNQNTQDSKTNKLSDYTLYIFCGILIILILVGYAIYKKIKNKNDNYEDD